MAKRKKVDITMTEAVSVGDAMNYIFIGLKYFLMTHTYKTLLVLTMMISGPCYIGWQYFTSDMVKIEKAHPVEEAQPIGKAGFTIRLWDEAIAAESNAVDRIPIRIHGQLYGYADSRYQIWKLSGESILLIHDTVTKNVWKMDVPTFDNRK